MNSTTIQHLINNIRQIRESKSYSQEYMAAKLGIGQNGYSKIELSKSKITVERLFQIAALLETDVMSLMDQNRAATMQVA